MIARRLMDPSPKLNWDVVVSVRDAINTQHWIRGRYAEDFRGACAGLYCINLLLDSDYVHAADILVNGVKVFVAPTNCAPCEAGEQAAGNGDVHAGKGIRPSGKRLRKSRRTTAAIYSAAVGISRKPRARRNGELAS